MNVIKHLKEDKIELNGVVYKPYTICDLPNAFGMSEEFERQDGTKVRYPLIPEWVKYRGYVYIAE